MDTVGIACFVFYAYAVAMFHQRAESPLLLNGFEASRRFHAMPDAAKRALLINDSHRGYMAPKTSQIVPNSNGETSGSTSAATVDSMRRA